MGNNPHISKFNQPALDYLTQDYRGLGYKCSPNTWAEASVAMHYSKKVITSDTKNKSVRRITVTFTNIKSPSEARNTPAQKYI